jgi:hypothetical protein
MASASFGWTPPATRNGSKKGVGFCANLEQGRPAQPVKQISAATLPTPGGCFGSEARARVDPSEERTIVDGRASLPESDDGVSRATDQSVPEEEEDQISFEKAWTRTRGHTLRFGETISEDKRLQKILQREYFMLTVIAPRVRGLSDAIREWSRSSASHSVWVSCVVVTILHVAFSVGCATAFGGMCAGGPELAEDDTVRPVARGPGSWRRRRFCC